jgi:hypothetical protein
MALIFVTLAMGDWGAKRVFYQQQEVKVDFS